MDQIYGISDWIFLSLEGHCVNIICQNQFNILHSKLYQEEGQGSKHLAIRTTYFPARHASWQGSNFDLNN